MTSVTGMTKFYDFIDESLDGKRQPQLHIYLRTSKANGNLTNVNTQVTKLSKMLSHFLDNELYYSNQEWYFDTKLSLNEDINKSGIFINDGLQSMVDSLGTGDYVLFADVSRITRLDIRSKTFKYLIEQLFKNQRSVFTVIDNRVARLSRPEFTNYAKLSNEYYQILDERSSKGNVAIISNMTDRMKECVKLHHEGMTQIIIAKQLNVSIKTVQRYVKQLRKFGYINASGKNKLSKITSPEAHIE
jgi:DNA-binding MarR family transcriptional regulator